MQGKHTENTHKRTVPPLDIHRSLICWDYGILSLANSPVRELKRKSLCGVIPNFNLCYFLFVKAEVPNIYLNTNKTNKKITNTVNCAANLSLNYLPQDEEINIISGFG